MQNAPSRSLKKVLGTGFGVAVMVGSTIGVGILRTPGTIASQIENYWLILLCWIIGGAYVLLGAGPFAEMATMMPKAGGPYNYVKRAFGEYAGFLTGWFDFIVNAIAPSYFCIVISEYTALLFPVLKEHQTVLAIIFLVAIVPVHLGGTTYGSVLQQVTSVIKVVFFTALIISCFTVKVDPGQTMMQSTTLKTGVLLGFFKSMQLVTGAYDGWWSVCFFAEEDKDPNKNIPRSLFRGGIMVTLIYLLLNVAIFYIVPVESLTSSSLAASEAANIVFGPFGATFVIVLSIVSLLSILNAYMMIPPRILYGLSRDGFFIKAGTKINQGGTPFVTLIISSSISLLLILGGTFEQLFTLASFMVVVVMVFSFAAHIKLRISEPDATRPYKAWGYPWTTLTVIVISLALFIGFGMGDRQNLLLILGAGVLTIPAYFLIRNRKASGPS